MDRTAERAGRIDRRLEAAVRKSAAVATSRTTIRGRMPQKVRIKAAPSPSPTRSRARPWGIFPTQWGEFPTRPAGIEAARTLRRDIIPRGNYPCAINDHTPTTKHPTPHTNNNNTTTTTTITIRPHTPRPHTPHTTTTTPTRAQASRQRRSRTTTGTRIQTPTADGEMVRTHGYREAKNLLAGRPRCYTALPLGCLGPISRQSLPHACSP